MKHKGKIIVTVSDKGDVHVSVQGIPGKSCEKATMELERALGMVTKRTKTKDYFKTDKVLAEVER